MFGPPRSDSEDSDDEFGGISFSTDFDEFGNRVNRKKAYNNNYINKPVNDPVAQLTKLIEKRDIDAIRAFVANNPKVIDIDQALFGTLTPLMYACHEQDVELTKYLLLELKADVNRSVDGFTPLAIACSTTYSDHDFVAGAEPKVLQIVKLLLEKKALINVCTARRETPLMFAAKNGFTSVVKLLIEHDASLEAIDNFDKSALFYAIDGNHLDVTKLLIEAGAQTDTENRHSQTPRMYAQYKGYTDIENLFPEPVIEPYVPIACTGYNSYMDLVPSAFPNNDIPAYAPDVYKLLYGMRSKNLEYKFFEAKVSLPELLTITDERLQEIGLLYPFQRKRIFHGLLKFHEHRFTPQSLPPLHWKKKSNLESYFNVFSGCLKHLVIIKGTLTFIESHGVFDADTKLTDNSLRYRREINDILLAIRKSTRDLLQSMQTIDENMTPRPPLYIDQHAIDMTKKRNKAFRKVAMITGIGVAVIALVVIKSRFK